MTDWPSDELEKIAAADELQLASARPDGRLRKPVTIWVVRLGDDIYVRSVNGRTSHWFRGVEDRHEGHIRAGGVDKDVRFVEAGDDVNDEIEAAYRTKYRALRRQRRRPTVHAGSQSGDARARAALIVVSGRSAVQGCRRPSRLQKRRG
mgnify:CR=1 FL=1